MRFIAAVAGAMLAAVNAATAAPEFLSREAVIDWMDGYRLKPEPARVPAALRALSRANAFKDPEASGFHVGFLAGVIGADPARAETLIAKLPPLPAADQWVAVRAIADSGLPDWQKLLRKFSGRWPARQTMIEDYLSGKLQPLDRIELDKSPTFIEKIRTQISGGEKNSTDVSFGKNPELIDELWGQYFATGAYRPVERIVTILPWSKDGDSADRLTIGSSAKYTLASNGARYPDLLAMLKRAQPHQPPEVAAELKDVIHAAETVQAARIRKEQVAAIDELKRKGPGSRRKMSMWGQIGQGAIAVGCIALAATGQVAFGIPCVVGGATSSALLTYWTSQ